jgi:hypothetical protein
MELKLPLKYSSHRQILDADGNLACEVFSGGPGIKAADELQELIVTACNAHDQMAAALKAARDRLTFANKHIDCAEEIAAANAALTAAGVTP